MIYYIYIYMLHDPSYVSQHPQNTLNPPALSSPRSLAAAAQALARWSRAMNPPTWNSKIDGEYLLMIINDS
jgi:hypothetical protein